MAARSRAQPAAEDVTGLAVLDKEPGWTSHDVVARCRRTFGQRRIGHAGTLDPDATGILLVGLGRFTRLLRFVGALGKTYHGEVVLGVATSTLDASGDVVGTWDMAGVSLDDVRQAAQSLTGAIEQVPPMVSAVKVGGRRLHELARAGIEVDRAPRPVTVDRFEVYPSADGLPGVFRIEVDCSTGTYVRVLAADLGAALGGGAHLRHLQRTQIGSFGLDEAHRIDELTVDHVLTPAQGLRDMTHLRVDEDVARRISHGLTLDGPSLGAVGPGPWALVDESDALLAVYEGTEGTEGGPLAAVCVLASSS